MTLRTPSRLAALLLAVAPGLASPAESSTLPAVKAAFVFNFIKLVSWPESRLPAGGATVQVCALRGDEMEPALRQALNGKMTGSHPIQVQMMDPGDNLSTCHVLYLGNPSARSALMARVGGKGVLLVDEGQQFSWPDGMIRLFQEQNRMRFELNLDSLERAGLKVDPRLIRLARIATR
ncbi:MAG TPA: YfiR family protein [Verrucomicrobiae bacterium]|nr:YfiR family protein [Verrucomicrobiae bacterium]